MERDGQRDRPTREIDRQGIIDVRHTLDDDFTRRLQRPLGQHNTAIVDHPHCRNAAVSGKTQRDVVEARSQTVDERPSCDSGLAIRRDRSGRIGSGDFAVCIRIDGRPADLDTQRVRRGHVILLIISDQTAGLIVERSRRSIRFGLHLNPNLRVSVGRVMGGRRCDVGLSQTTGFNRLCHRPHRLPARIIFLRMNLESNRLGSPLLRLGLIRQHELDGARP